MRLQNTLKDEIFISGLGLHSGRNISMRLRPAPSNTGIVFIRTDKGNVRIKASISTVSDTTFATTLASEGVRIGTVEHLLAALAGLHVDNVYVELNGPEVPIMDGSAYSFVSRIMECGIVKQEKAVSYIRILAPIVVMEGHSQIAITPYEGTRITYRLFYTHPAFGEQKMGIDISTTSFINDLAPARTFGFLRDVEMLKSRGLAQGGSLDNAIVLGENEVINGNMLRFKDEFVRHKILDAVGDLSLIGLPIHGHIIANKSGHTLHIKLLRKILLLRDSWEIITPSVVAPAVSELAASV
ncbi:MAG: UDP-3-O-acyl-N-acetylglucosamine deacetylase [Nitrospiraceae bacterium]|nr:MAG: UDP-3-O-acyl-N-acetylglucosamine deacetylase [Nitrospiraceae bacterium]